MITTKTVGQYGAVVQHEWFLYYFPNTDGDYTVYREGHSNENEAAQALNDIRYLEDTFKRMTGARHRIPQTGFLI